MTPQTPIGRRQLTPLGQARGVALPWWNPDGTTPGGVGGTCVAAYQAKGAANYAASKVNLANPGTYDATEGTAPGWTLANGWEGGGLGSAQYLTTGINTSAYAADTLSMIVRITRIADPGNLSICACGSSLFGNFFSLYDHEAANLVYYNKVAGYNIAPTLGGDGTLAIAGRQGYRNGVADGTLRPSGAYPNNILYLLAQPYAGAQYYFRGYEAAFAFYSVALTAPQVLARHTAIMAL